jgi:hypothetical protein
LYDPQLTLQLGLCRLGHGLDEDDPIGPDMINDRDREEAGWRLIQVGLVNALEGGRHLDRARVAGQVEQVNQPLTVVEQTALFQCFQPEPTPHGPLSFRKGAWSTEGIARGHESQLLLS